MIGGRQEDGAQRGTRTGVLRVPGHDNDDNAVHDAAVAGFKLLRVVGGP